MVAFAVVLFVLGGLLLWLGARNLGVLVGRLAAPRSGPGQLRPGPATVHGTLQAAAEPVQAPLSGVPCSWWSFSVEERRRARSGSIWYVVAQGASSQAALLHAHDHEDDGVVRVDLHGARVQAGAEITVPANQAGALTLAQLRRLAAGLTDDANPTEAANGPTDAIGDTTPRAVLVPPRSKHGDLDPDAPLATAPGTWRIIESHLPPGTLVWASGTARRPPADGPALELCGTADRPLLISTGGVRDAVSPLTRRAATGSVLGLAAWFGAVSMLTGTAVQVLLAILPFAALGLVCARALRSARPTTPSTPSAAPGPDGAGQRKATGV